MMRRASALLRRQVPRRGIEEFMDLAHAGKSEVVHGRAWTAKELRRKSFDDLHKLWYVLYKEKNAVLTERQRARTLGREMRAPERLKELNLSISRLRHVIDDRRKVLKAAREGRLEAEEELAAAEATAGAPAGEAQS